MLMPRKKHWKNIRPGDEIGDLLITRLPEWDPDVSEYPVAEVNCRRCGSRLEIQLPTIARRQDNGFRGCNHCVNTAQIFLGDQYRPCEAPADGLLHIFLDDAEENPDALTACRQRPGPLLNAGLGLLRQADNACPDCLEMVGQIMRYQETREAVRRNPQPRKCGPYSKTIVRQSDAIARAGGGIPLGNTDAPGAQEGPGWDPGESTNFDEDL